MNDSQRANARRNLGEGEEAYPNRSGCVCTDLDTLVSHVSLASQFFEREPQSTGTYPCHVFLFVSRKRKKDTGTEPQARTPASPHATRHVAR